MLEELYQRGFVEVPRVHRPFGVYALLRGREVIYVGQSKSVYDRLAAHYAARKKLPHHLPSIGPDDLRGIAVPFDRVMVFFCEKDNLLKLEMELIAKYRPKYNVQIRAPLPNVKIDVVALAREVGIEYRKVEPKGIYRRRVA